MEADIMSAGLEGPLSTLITTAGLIIVAAINLLQGRKIKRIDEQTTNSHQNTEYPNLRDEQSAVRSKVEALETKSEDLSSKVVKMTEDLSETSDAVSTVRGSVRGMTRTLSRIEEWLSDLSNDRDLIDDTISRKELAQERKLAAAVEERKNGFKEHDRRLTRLEEEIPAVIERTIEKNLKALGLPPQPPAVDK